MTVVARSTREPAPDMQAIVGNRSPRYVQIVESLIRRLAAKEWNAGDSLPSEAALAAEYGVSLGTMRKAIDQMASQNLVVRRQGKGTYVAAHDWNRAIFNYFRLVGDDGGRHLPSSRVEKLERGFANKIEAHRLALDVGAEVLRALRVRSFNSTPFIAERLVIPVARLPNFTANVAGDLPPLIYEHYSKQDGVIVMEAVERLRAVPADATDAKLLNVPIKHPLLEVDRIAVAFDKNPVEWRVGRCDTSHHYYLNKFS
jgi:GntR family transcriptional regulator